MNPIKAFLAVCTLLMVSVWASDVNIVEHFTLKKGRVVLQAGQRKQWTGERLKKSDEKWGNKRVGLHLRAIAISSAYNGGWTMIMQIKVNGRLVERYNTNAQPRLMNRPEAKKLTGGPNVRYSGEPWFNRFFKSWDVGYGTDFSNKKEFNPYFEEDITDYLFDIDDLVTVDAPVEVEIINIANTVDGLKNLMEQKGRIFPLALSDVELVRFENPADRTAASKAIPAPKKEVSQAMRERIRTFSHFSVEENTAILRELTRAEKLFMDCKRHELRGYVIPGQLWIQYDSRKRNAESYVPMLDKAKAIGVGLVKVHSYWADINATSPFRPRNEGDAKDFRKFIELCHARGMKCLAYVSPAWVKHNTDYSKTWEFSDSTTAPSGKEKWGQVCTGSPQWRSYFFGNVQKLFNDYPVDGIYVDIGINNTEEKRCMKEDHSHPFVKDKLSYASTLDMMTRLYALCRKNSKLLYLFAETQPGMENVCDVQYVGESTPSMNTHRERHGDFKGNIYFLTMTHGFTYYSMREVYGTTMVLGHFPLFNYYDWMKNWEEEFAWYCHYLPLWCAMNAEGSHIYRDIKKSALLKSVPKDGMVTAYVNTDTYLVAANFGSKPAIFVFSEAVVDMESGKSATTITVPERDFRILRMYPALQNK